MKILNNQTVGHSLTLECSVATVRGITSRVDIMWNSDGLEVKSIKGVNFSSVTNDSELVQFIDSYIIPQLTTADEGRLYQCGVFVGTKSPIKVTETISLNVTG